MQGSGNRGRPVSTLSNLLAAHTDLSGASVAHLQRIVAEWQLLADLSFADFLLWVPVTSQEGTRRFLCMAQSRPTTTATAHPEDMVGSAPAETWCPSWSGRWTTPRCAARTSRGGTAGGRCAARWCRCARRRRGRPPAGAR